MEASWDSNYIVNNMEVVWKDDDLVKCDEAQYIPGKISNIVIYNRRTLHHANQALQQVEWQSINT